MHRNRRDIVLQLPRHEHNSADIGFVFYKGGGGKHLSHSFHNIETLHLSHHGISLIRIELFDLEKKVDLMKFRCAHRVFQIENIWWSTLQKCHCIMNYTSYATWNQTKSSSQVWTYCLVWAINTKNVLISPGNSSSVFCFSFPHSSFQMIIFLNMAHVRSNEGFKRLHNKLFLLQAHPLLHVRTKDLRKLC